MKIRVYQSDDLDAVVALWRICELLSPGNDPVDDIDAKIAVQPDLFWVGTHDDTVVATVMVGYDGHRGWINYLATHPSHRGNGYGRAMMMQAEAVLLEYGCPKINLQVRSGNTAVVGFYESLGYTVEERVSMGKRIGERTADTSDG
ncbi:MAG: GNAT family acetyltransferase [Pseudomonadota bacterium]